MHDDTGSAATVTARRPTPAGDNGTGLLLVDALAATWGKRAQPTGETVWFDVHVLPLDAPPLSVTST